MAERKRLVVLANRDVKKVSAYIPEGHKHIRVSIETDDTIIVLQEATVAAIVRAYLNVLLHPVRRSFELKQARLDSSQRKSGYAEHQLIEDP